VRKRGNGLRSSVREKGGREVFSGLDEKGKPARRGRRRQMEPGNLARTLIRKRRFLFDLTGGLS